MAWAIAVGDFKKDIRYTYAYRTTMPVEIV